MRNRGRVKIILADGDSVFRQGLRNGLGSEGYRDVRAVARIDAVRDLITYTMPDLLVIDGDLREGDPEIDAIDLIKEIRNQETGRNPFLPIIMTMWDSGPALVRRAVDSGVDAILAKPLAPADLLARIDGVAFERKPFLVTADYIGPDRRKGERCGDIEFFEVPNTLKDKLEGKAIDVAGLSGQIESTMQAMKATLFARLRKAALEDEDFKTGYVFVPSAGA